MLIQRNTKGYSDTKDAVANYLGHRTGEGFGNLRRGSDYWGSWVCVSRLHTFRVTPNRGEELNCAVETKCDVSISRIWLDKWSFWSFWPTDIFSCVHDLCLLFQLSTLISDSPFQTPPGNHRFLLQIQLFPLAAFYSLTPFPMSTGKTRTCFLPYAEVTQYRSPLLWWGE